MSACMLNLQCSCLENPRDGGAWWAAIYGVAQSQTWLTWLSSSSSMLNCFSQSVQSLSRVRLFATPWIAAYQASLSITNSRSSINSRPLSQWCHPTISSSVVPFSSCPQSLPASGSFPKSQLFAWGGQTTGVSALASVLPKNTQGWSPLEWTGPFYQMSFNAYIDILIVIFFFILACWCYGLFYFLILN